MSNEQGHRVTITRHFEIDAGHRLVRHEGKCANIHGHRYGIQLTIASVRLDHLGRVIDFSAVKELFGTWLDDKLDHAMIVQEFDPLLVWLKENNQKFYTMEHNPTAERLAQHLYDVAKSMLEIRDLEVCKVRVYETPNCYADFPGGTYERD